ncbi:MAG: DUF664 domain-containing protein [Nitrospiraceae bacterium]|nr:DUF664 domain-containing protein [Nitrospiraceae bacterium]
MDGAKAVEILKMQQKFLGNILKGFTPEHGDFVPVEGMMTVAQQVRHIADTFTWFRAGAFEGQFDMDFEKLEAENRKPVTWEEATATLDAALAGFIALLAPMSEADLSAPMVDNPIFGMAPKETVIGAAADHVAHHRGALSVYQRLLGITPAMIYEMA